MPKHTCISFTPEERKHIEKRLKEGILRSHIAKELGRPKSSVWAEIKLNGGPNNYNADVATKRWHDRRQIWIEKKKNVRMKKAYEFCLKDRVDAIEMQIEIILETLKEIKK